MIELGDDLGLPAKPLGKLHRQVVAGAPKIKDLDRHWRIEPLVERSEQHANAADPLDLFDQVATVDLPAKQGLLPQRPTAARSRADRGR